MSIKWHHLFGTTVAGNRGTVPGDWLRVRLEYPPVVHVSEDAFTLWLGTKDEWMCHMSRTDARRLAVFILFRWWIGAEWFGIRRWLYYKGLRRYLKVSNPPMPSRESS